MPSTVLWLCSPWLCWWFPICLLNTHIWLNSAWRKLALCVWGSAWAEQTHSGTVQCSTEDTSACAADCALPVLMEHLRWQKCFFTRREGNSFSGMLSCSSYWHCHCHWVHPIGGAGSSPLISTLHLQLSLPSLPYSRKCQLLIYYNWYSTPACIFSLVCPLFPSRW